MVIETLRSGYASDFGKIQLRYLIRARITKLVSIESVFILQRTLSATLKLDIKFDGSL